MNGARLELRRADAGGPVLLEPTRHPLGDRRLDPLCGRQRGAHAAADRVLVAARAGADQPAREVLAEIPAAVARGAEPRGASARAPALGALTQAVGTTGPAGAAGGGRAPPVRGPAGGDRPPGAAAGRSPGAGRRVRREPRRPVADRGSLPTATAGVRDPGTGSVRYDRGDR